MVLIPEFSCQFNYLFWSASLEEADFSVVLHAVNINGEDRVIKMSMKKIDSASNILDIEKQLTFEAADDS